MDLNKKTAIVMMNLGGPDKIESIKPYLNNFFMDKNIIGAPKFIRYFIAKLIASRRSKGEALEAYSALGGKSPLLDNTIEQQKALQLEFDKRGMTNFKTFVSMRYWHPFAKDVVKEIGDEFEDIILLPLYPQFSTATTKSSFEEFNQYTDKELKTICCYPDLDGFIQASKDHIITEYKKAIKENPNLEYRILFSAHGLPEKIVKSGDPYQKQCKITSDLIQIEIEKELGHKIDAEICYQSRVGPLKWIGPSTEEALEKAAKEDKSVIIYTHAFVSEHVETIVEIGEEYREVADELGIKDYRYAKTVGVNKKFIEGLADLVVSNIENNFPQPRKCDECKKCWHKIKNF